MEEVTKLNKLIGFAYFWLVTALFSVSAAPRPGFEFSHHDWILACDNTGTCRAAGYQSEEGDGRPVSVLLVRKAGPHQAVTGELTLGNTETEDGEMPTSLVLRIDGRSLGRTNFGRAEVANLPRHQVDGLLSALVRKSQVEWSADDGRRWMLSGKGAAAVFLKMDEFQERLGTEMALLRKGARGEESVRPLVPAPVVRAAKVRSAQEMDRELAGSEELRESIRATVDQETCAQLFGGYERSQSVQSELSVQRLTRDKMLVSTNCWLAAYNGGLGYWVINEKPPHSPVLVTTNGTDYDDGVISSAQKGRGLGDCWSHEDWTWDGQQFVETSAYGTGLCRMVALGGAWVMPTLVTEVLR